MRGTQSWETDQVWHTLPFTPPPPPGKKTKQKKQKQKMKSWSNKYFGRNLIVWGWARWGVPDQSIYHY